MKRKEAALYGMPPPVTIEQQLENKANFIKDGKLFLVRCVNCGGARGSENYATYVAKGVCAWCKWEMT